MSRLAHALLQHVHGALEHTHAHAPKHWLRQGKAKQEDTPRLDTPPRRSGANKAADKQASKKAYVHVRRLASEQETREGITAATCCSTTAAPCWSNPTHIGPAADAVPPALWGAVKHRPAVVGHNTPQPVTTACCGWQPHTHSLGCRVARPPRTCTALSIISALCTGAAGRHTRGGCGANCECGRMHSTSSLPQQPTSAHSNSPSASVLTSSVQKGYMYTLFEQPTKLPAKRLCARQPHHLLHPRHSCCAWQCSGSLPASLPSSLSDPSHFWCCPC